MGQEFSTLNRSSDASLSQSSRPREPVIGDDDDWEKIGIHPRTRGRTSAFALASASTVRVGRYNTVEGVPEGMSTADLRKHLLEDEMHFGVKCRSCEKKNFVGYRYKCVLCRYYNLCADCFEAKKVTYLHDLSHPMLLIWRALDIAMQNWLRHLFDMRYLFEMNSTIFENLQLTNKFSGTKCKYCGADPITGVYFQCDDCVELEWCWPCHNKHSEEVREHANDYDHSIVVHFVPDQRTFDRTAVRYVDHESDKKKHVRKVIYEGKSYMIKFIRLDDYGRGRNQNFMRPFRDTRSYFKLRSNSIVHFFGSVLREDTASMYVLMEYMPTGSLQQVIEKQRVREVVSYRRKVEWMLQVIKGIRRMHAANFVHLDLRPATILLTENENVKIGSIATKMTSDGCRLRCGKCEFHRAPEFHLNQRITEKADIFSVGVLIHETFTNVQRQDTQYPARLTPESRILPRLIQACVDADPLRRPNAKYLEGKLEKLRNQFWSNLSHGEFTDEDNGPINEDEYKNATLEEKNRAFLKMYDKVKSEIDRPAFLN